MKYTNYYILKMLYFLNSIKMPEIMLALYARACSCIAGGLKTYRRTHIPYFYTHAQTVFISRAINFHFTVKRTNANRARRISTSTAVSRDSSAQGHHFYIHPPDAHFENYVL